MIYENPLKFTGFGIKQYTNTGKIFYRNFTNKCWTPENDFNENNITSKIIARDVLKDCENNCILVKFHLVKTNYHS